MYLALLTLGEKGFVKGALKMGSTNPIISVIIPVYNAERYIAAALRSVCDQTYERLEIIVIDDGSTDNSKKEIQSIKDHRIKLVSRENRGLISTLNEAVTLSSGAYIARMDADDVCHPKRIASQLNFLLDNPSVGVAFTEIEYIDENGEKIREKAMGKAEIINPVELLFGCPLCHPTAVFDMNKLLKKDIIYNERFKNTEDYELWTRLISKTRIGILREILFRYRIHPGSITSQNSSDQRNKAVNAILQNLISSSTVNDKKHFFIIYNNHLGSHSLVETLKSLSFIFIKLKSINNEFSRYKYAKKSYHLLKKKMKPSNRKLRESKILNGGN